MKIVSFLLCVFLLVSCGKREEPISLGDGYFFFRTNSFNHYITYDNEFVVDSNIIEYDVYGHFIFGLREPPERLDTDEKFISENYGYFILDKRSGELKEGLEKAELEKIIGLK